MGMSIKIVPMTEAPTKKSCIPHLKILIDKGCFLLFGAGAVVGSVPGVFEHRFILNGFVFNRKVFYHLKYELRNKVYR